MKLLQRQRSSTALKWIERWEKRANLSDAATKLKGLPITLRSQGLIATCATLLKGDDLDNDIATALARWLGEAPHHLASGLTSNASGKDLLQIAIELDNMSYRSLQREAIAYAEHLKLIAEAWDNG